MNTDSATLPSLLVVVWKTLPGFPRRVQVETVVPIRPADQRQAVRADALERIADAALQVLVKRRLAARLVIIGHRLIQNRPVAGLFEIGRHAEHQPERIIVEIAADVVVAALGEGLVLVVSPTSPAIGWLARSRMRWRARSGTMCTNPSRSWFESRKPMPRPMPDSK